MIVRWLKFNLVGGAGVAVQLAMLWLLTRAGVPYLIATVQAVETAVLHNFVWHERWTWRYFARGGRVRRLIRFQFANGVLSVASNALFTWLIREHSGLPVLVSNAAAIGATGILNFALAEVWVFRRHPLAAQQQR